MRIKVRDLKRIIREERQIAQFEKLLKKELGILNESSAGDSKLWTIFSTLLKDERFRKVLIDVFSKGATEWLPAWWDNRKKKKAEQRGDLPPPDLDTLPPDTEIQTSSSGEYEVVYHTDDDGIPDYQDSHPTNPDQFLDDEDLEALERELEQQGAITVEMPAPTGNF